MFTMFATFTNVRYVRETRWPHCRLCFVRSSSVLFVMFAHNVPWENNDDSDDDLFLLLSLCKRKRKWVHDVNLKRTKFGEFHHLIKQLREDEVKFKDYFRMNTNQFDHLLSLIKDDIEKKSLNYRESITAVERLAVCLR